MVLSFTETRAISGLAHVLYDFLPGSGRSDWKGHETFATVAARVGAGSFWPGGSKKPAIHALLAQTLEHRRHLFEKLILEIVRCGMIYRENQGRPISTTEIDDLNGHVKELGFKFPALWDSSFRASLAQTTTERARDHVKHAEDELNQQLARERHSQALLGLKEEFLQLNCEPDRNKAGLALEKLLNRLFELFELNPRGPFRVIGEQIDGSFELDSEIYLVEAKWENHRLSEKELLVFKGKIEAKSTFTRGLFIALNDVTGEAKEAITRGKAPMFFVMNGHDLMMVLCQGISLTDFLRKRVRMLAEEGRMFVPFAAISD